MVQKMKKDAEGFIDRYGNGEYIKTVDIKKENFEFLKAQGGEIKQKTNDIIEAIRVSRQLRYPTLTMSTMTLVDGVPTVYVEDSKKKGVFKVSIKNNNPYCLTENTSHCDHCGVVGSDPSLIVAMIKESTK